MTFFVKCDIISVGGEIVLWYEFVFKPYRHMNTNQRLRYEYELDVFEIDNYSEQEFLEDVYCDCDEVEVTWGKK